MAWLPLLFLKVLRWFLSLSSASMMIGYHRTHFLVLHCKFVTPLPIFSRCDGVGLNLLCFEHTLTVWVHLWSLIEFTQSVWVVHALWLGELVKVSLTEGQRIIVNELILLGLNELWPRLFKLFAICKCNLGFGTVRHALDSYHASSFSQLAYWRHLATL